MSSIYLISEALKTLLQRGHKHSIELLDPVEAAAKNTVSLWLYQVQPDDITRNYAPPVIREAQATAGGTTKRLRSAVAPLAIKLHYLVTPMLDDTQENQNVLGRLMLNLHESPELKVIDADSRQEELIRIAIAQDAGEECGRIWDLLKEKYRLSFLCSLRVARLYSSQIVEEAPVLSISTAPLPDSPWN